jgi:hypothetical protein
MTILPDLPQCHRPAGQSEPDSLRSTNTPQSSSVVFLACSGGGCTPSGQSILILVGLGARGIDAGLLGLNVYFCGSPAAGPTVADPVEEVFEEVARRARAGTSGTVQNL